MSINKTVVIEAKWSEWLDLAKFIFEWYGGVSLHEHRAKLYMFFLIKPFFEGRLNTIIERGKPEGNKPVKASLKPSVFIPLYDTLKEASELGENAPMLFKFDKCYVNLPEDILI